MRTLPALHEGYFHLDEMQPADLLAMACEFAGIVKFYNMDNVHDGDWKFYFSADETLLISRILSTDTSAAVAAFDRWWSLAPEMGAGAGSKKWQASQLPVASLASLINGWFMALEAVSNETGQKLRVLIADVIEQLRANDPDLIHLLAQAGDGLQLHPVWSGAGLAPTAGAISKATVRSNFYAFVKAVEMIKKEAFLRLPESLKSQHHDPAIGLLIAFVQLFQRLKKKLNRFTQNYLDFYYDKILKSVPQPAIPDKTCLVFEINAPDGEVRIARQTEFLAGLDVDKRDIIYLSDEELSVNDARVCSLQTVFFEHNRYSSPENLLGDDEGASQAGGNRCWPTNAWINRVPLSTSSSAPDHVHAQPLFGAQKHPGRLFEDARLGFALSSNVLLLKEGLRNITITLQFSSNALTHRIDNLAAVTGADATVNDDRAALHRQDMFFKAFRNMFRIAVTCENGWFEVQDYVPLYTATGGIHTLQFEFELSPEAPAVTPYDSRTHGEQYGTTAPVARFVINPGAYLYPYGMLRKLPLANVLISVDVQGCRDLVLHNNIGRISAATPFTPFGPLPRIGSYLIIGSTEMACKQLSNFSIDIEWAGLPLAAGGFNTYYRSYGVDVDNEDFLVRVSVLSRGAWGPADAKMQPVMPLFRTVVQPGQEARIASHIQLTCDSVAHQFHPSHALPPGVELEYNTSAKNGFFKFTLTSPEFAFGHDKYPHVLASTLIANSRLKYMRRQRAIPPLPYTPLINAISIRYRADARIPLDYTPADGTACGDKFLHLYPSGWEILGPFSYPAPALLPQYDYTGNLHIGISATALKGPVTLFFHLREDSLPLSNRNEPVLDWFYLASNTWRPLYKKNIVSDSTEHFMTSGIVTLDLPSDISNDNSVMPSGLYWLRLSANSDLEKYCSVYAVHAQAVQVCRQHAVHSETAAILPAGTIKRSKKNIPGLVKITQVIDSFGGRPAETRSQLRTRVSERLRHKNRAISAADYELLVLQQFPDVYKVKCFANMATDRGPTDCVRPGQVLVVPLPYWPRVRRRHQMPMLNGNRVLEIQAFLEGLSSQWTTISVENPVYEQIQVRCQVKLKDGLSGGYYNRRLDQDISDFLMPWNDTCGYRTHFGWCIRRDDIEAFIGTLDYIDCVTRFSMLRITSTDACTFTLFDTAADPGNAKGCGDTHIRPQYPWSLAIPAASHAIDVVAGSTPVAAARTALSELQIGSTFIISAGEDDDKDNGQT